MQFTELSLDGGLLSGISDAGFTECTSVQERAFTDTLEKRDVYVQSQTGSGKTAAFLISIFEHFVRGTFNKNRAIIIVPTRELAVQIEEEAKLLGKHLPFRVGSFYGGVGYDKQLSMLEQGYEVIIGTPGRLIDLDQRRKLDFKESSVVVIDEADRLFDMGFLPDIRKMLRRMPASENRLTMLFSATLNGRVWQLAWEFMNDPVQIVMNPENLTVSEVHQELYHVANSDKFKLLLGILDREKAQNVLIFTNTKNGAEEISQRLEYNGYHSRFIIGDLQQKKRLQLIDQMKAGDLQILVATDVAARGLHINDLPLVINYDLPEDPEGYVHRIGRTARAGNTGKAVTLACERFVYSLEAIEELIDSKIPTEWHDETMLLADKSEGQRIEHHRQSGQSRDRRGTPSRAGHNAGRSQRPGRPAGAGSDRRPGHRPEKTGATQGRDTGGSRQGSQRPGRQEPRQSVQPDRGSERQRNDKRQAAPAGPRRASSASDQAAGKKSAIRGSEALTRGALSADASIEERLAHYRKKYGEDFTLAADATDAKRGTKAGSRGQGKRKREPQKPPQTTPNQPAGQSVKSDLQSDDGSAAGKISVFSRLFGKKKKNSN